MGNMGGVDIAGMGICMGSGDVGGMTDVDEAVDRNVIRDEDMGRGWGYDAFFETEVDLEIGDTAVYPLPTMIDFFTRKERVYRNSP